MNLFSAVYSYNASDCWCNTNTSSLNVLTWCTWCIHVYSLRHHVLTHSTCEQFVFDQKPVCSQGTGGGLMADSETWWKDLNLSIKSQSQTCWCLMELKPAFPFYLYLICSCIASFFFPPRVSDEWVVSMTQRRLCCEVGDLLVCHINGRLTFPAVLQPQILIVGKRTHIWVLTLCIPWCTSKPLSSKGCVKFY